MSVFTVEGKYKPHPQSASSTASTKGVTVSGLGSETDTDGNITPVDNNPQKVAFNNLGEMASPGEYDAVPDDDSGTPNENGDAKGGKENIGGTQAGVIEMSTLITQPGLKRAESTEILHLTLHQVMIM